jgi:hypothetical protein
VTTATRDRLVFLGALLAGVLGWASTLPSGGREAWDVAFYWLIVLPLSYGLLFGLGYLGSRGAWRWPALLFGGQLATMILARALEGDGAGSVAPLGAVLFGLLAAVGMAPTYLGVALRRWRQRLKAARFAARLRRAELEAGIDGPR